MHIPDGYLGPITCGAGYAVMAPVWAVAANRVKKTLAARQVPLLAMGAAFSFVIMMFNIPIPGGTSGHAVGAVLVAILLGPWAATIAVSVALVIQALLFGDGGITAFGANCFNMAFVMPFTGYAVYRMTSGKSPARVVSQGGCGQGLQAMWALLLHRCAPVLNSESSRICITHYRVRRCTVRTGCGSQLPPWWAGTCCLDLLNLR